MSLFSSTPSLLCRIAAIAAILFSGVGKTIHQHQHCHGSCGDVACCTDAPSQVPDCPFGCDSCHLSSPDVDQHSRGSHAPTHNAAECSVCQVLAMAPEITAIAQAPDLNESVRRHPDSSWQSPCLGSFMAVCSRGPPTAEIVFPVA